ncbi:Predicted O-methyltransferase YrrM [Flavobacteriaceae bacterium MAR_2010_188]|nr:Predicted O-methyltransferase YrrM [Flavobacteriaceae bacterium MAR_2010_188]
MYQILQYLKFLWKSKNQHDVHSPFVFDFVTKCLYDKKTYPEYRQIENFRKKLKSDQTKLQIDDLGAGSRILNSHERKISELAKTSGSSQKQSRLLVRLAKYFQPNKILELGTSLGISTYAFALGSEEAKIITVEGAKQLFDFTSNQAEFEGRNIHFFNNNFENQLEQFSEEKWDMVFLDGDHTKDGTLNYFESLLKNLHNNSVLIIDDIYWSNGMTEAWELIKTHPKVKVTVDLFFKGLVFFREEQAKENFKIRL